jgi:DNA-binding NarL/FixJ family response regulator
VAALLGACEPPFETDSVPTLALALERLGRRVFDAVLLDLGLPDADGLAGVEVVVASFPALALVVLTGSSAEHLGVAAVRAGAQDYLLKGSADRRTLERALRYAIERKRAERSRLLETLDRFGSGVLLTNGSGRVFLSNRVADEILSERDGLALEGGRLVGVGPSAKLTPEILTVLSVRGASPPADVLPPARALALPRRPPRRPLSLVVTGGSSREASPSYPWLIAFVADPDRCSEGAEIILRRLFALSPAEGRLAHCLVQGRTVAEASRALGISVHTARTQLKKILEKTSTHRQGDLIRLLMTAAPAFPPPGRRHTPNE